MGIVKISDPMHDKLRAASDALSRSINAQVEHWLRIGMLAELHPQLTARNCRTVGPSSPATIRCRRSGSTW